MGITRIVETAVICDECGCEVMGWRSAGTGVSKDWAKYYARQRGCTIGKKIVCKECNYHFGVVECDD